MAHLAAVSLVIGIASMNAARIRNAAQLSRTPPVPADWLVHGYVSCLCNKIGFTFVAETALSLPGALCAATCPARCAGQDAEFYDCIPVATATGLTGLGGLMVPEPMVRHETVATRHDGLEYRYACICYGSGIRFVFGIETKPTGIYTYGGVGAPRDCNVQCQVSFNARGVGCVADVPANMEANVELALPFARKPLPNPPLWFAHGYEACFCTKDDFEYIAHTFAADCTAQCPEHCGFSDANFLECLPVATHTGGVGANGPPMLMRHETYALPDRRHTVYRYACVCYGFLTGTTKETGTGFVFGDPNQEKGIYSWGGTGCARSCRDSCKLFGAKTHGCFPDVPDGMIAAPEYESPRIAPVLEVFEEVPELAEIQVNLDAAHSNSPRTGLSPVMEEVGHGAEVMEDIRHGDDQEPPALVRQL